MTPVNECLLHIYSITPTIDGEIFLSIDRFLRPQESFYIVEKDGNFKLHICEYENDEVGYIDLVHVGLDKEWFMSKLDKPLENVYDIHSPEYMPLFIGEYIQHKINQQWSII